MPKKQNQGRTYKYKEEECCRRHWETLEHGMECCQSQCLSWRNKMVSKKLVLCSWAVIGRMHTSIALWEREDIGSFQVWMPRESEEISSFHMRGQSCHGHTLHTVLNQGRHSNSDCGALRVTKGQYRRWKACGRTSLSWGRMQHHYGSVGNGGHSIVASTWVRGFTFDVHDT